ncbi:hypothetical protein LX59_01569 [Azomonas agilis]|uniref:Uncharacterized protein n=1 Tax=Azomonas agilis TaxID=116849 RepID=A0A562IKE3_9GAMM|nr:hypothetical protein [Azomonas agilis]TWH71286.1 hypothetical protein LX59_01569 [Azomonas agilis]
MTLSDEDKNKIHRLFCAAISKEYRTRGRHIRFYDWIFTHNTHWGEAISEILEEGARPCSPEVKEALDNLKSALHKAKTQLKAVAHSYPHIYAGITQTSTSTIHRQMPITEPSTALEPIEEIGLVIQGVCFEQHILNRRTQGKHAIYEALIELWELVTHESIKTSPNSRLVQMLQIATGDGRESISKHLKRKKEKGGQKAPKT